MKAFFDSLLRRKQPGEAVAIQLVPSPVRDSASDDQKLNRLLDLLGRPPASMHDQNEWTAETASLISDLFMDRVAKEDLAAIFAGLLSYRKCGLTSQHTQFALIRAYCQTNGLAQELLHRMLFSSDAMRRSEQPSPFLGKFTAYERSQIMRSLQDTGYAMLPRRLAPDVVKELSAATLNMDYDLIGEGKRLGRVSKIDPHNPPPCLIADAVDEDVWASPLFSALARDPEIISLIEEHLGSSVTPCAAPLRYTFASETASSDGAQLFHYDLDTLRWLKVFYYLNDIDEENGPHVYVEGTQKLGAKSDDLLQRLYQRIPDEEFEDGRHGAIRTACGPAGTVIIGDTRCFHKGLNVRKGHRLLFFPLYAPSEFGMHHGSR